MGPPQRTIWVLVTLGVLWVVGLTAFLTANASAPAQQPPVDPARAAAAVVVSLPHGQPLPLDAACGHSRVPAPDSHAC